MKLFVVTSRVPWPLEKGDKLRMYNQLRMLSANNEIILCAISDTAVHPDAEKELKKFCREIHIFRFSKITLAFNLLRGFFTGIPFQVAYFTNPFAAKKIRKLVAATKPDRIFCQLIRTAEYARYTKTVPRILDYMDVFSKGAERRIGNVPGWQRWIFRMEWKRLLRYEAAVFRDFSAHTIISLQDRDLLPVTEKTKVQVIPNGVDTDFFQPVDREKKYDLLFNGNMNYPPNVESAEYLVRKVLPLVQKEKPGANVLISGATPAARVLALRSEHVTVTGWVDDVRESFAQSKILVAPMQSSIGLQNKLLEAMAMKIPCITTTLSNNAVKAIPDSQLLVADSPEQFATAILLLLSYPDKARQLGENGYRMVHERFDWKKNCTALEKIIRDAK